MKIQKNGKKGKSKKTNSFRDRESSSRVGAVLGRSKIAVPALLVGKSEAGAHDEASSAAGVETPTQKKKIDIMEALIHAEMAHRGSASLSEDPPGDSEKSPDRLEAIDPGTKNVRAAADTKTQIRNRDSREALVNAALHLFWEKGYGETKMQDVYDRCRVKAGSMYYFFRTKEELLLAVLDRLTEIMYPALLAPVWETVSDPIERIFGLLDVYRKGILASNFNYGCPVGRLAVEVSGEMLEVHKKIAMNFEGWSNAVQKCLEDAGPRLPKGMDLKMLSHFVLTVMEGGVMQSRSYKSIDPFDQGVAQLRDYFNRLEAQGEAEAMQRGESYWDLQKKKNKQGTDVR